MKKLPSRGAFVVYLNHELAAVLGYDLDRAEAHLIKLKDIPLEEAEEFVEAVSKGIHPGVPREKKITLETWEHYGLPPGAIDESTNWVWIKLKNGEVVKGDDEDALTSER